MNKTTEKGKRTRFLRKIFSSGDNSTKICVTLLLYFPTHLTEVDKDMFLIIHPHPPPQIVCSNGTKKIPNSSYSQLNIT